jgi:hypothetical protein
MNGTATKQYGRNRSGDPQNMLVRNWRAVLLAVFVSVLLLAPFAHAQERAAGPSATTQAGAAGSEGSGIDELIQVLIENGSINKEQAAALMEKRGQAGFSPLAALTELLKTKGIITSSEADRVAKRSVSGSQQAVTLYYEPTQKDLERITDSVTSEVKKDVREQVKAEIKQEVLQETKKEIQSAAAPEWTKRIRFSGDIRLRYEGDFFSKDNGEFLSPSNPTQILNSQTERDRFRVRARLGASAEVTDKVEAGVRLSTGDTINPVSSNQTMGTYLNKYSVVMDLAYLKFKPAPGFTLMGGRFSSPWFHADLVWWRDLTFEGVSATYQPNFSDVFKPFFTAGGFPLQEVELSTKDKYLFAGQAGIEIRPRKDLWGKIGVAYYDYVHTRGTANTPEFPEQFNFTAPQFQQKGNTLFNIQPATSTPLFALAADYRELNVTGMLDIGFWHPVHVLLTGDYVNNLGFDRRSVERLTGVEVPTQTQGYLAGLTVGYPEIINRWDWRVYGYYKYLEADAVLDAFTDPDFHLGGTNAKGWVMGADLGLGKNLWTSLKWVTTNEIKGPPFGIDSIFVDLNYRF